MKPDRLSEIRARLVGAHSPKIQWGPHPTDPRRLLVQTGASILADHCVEDVSWLVQEVDHLREERDGLLVSIVLEEALRHTFEEAALRLQDEVRRLETLACRTWTTCPVCGGGVLPREMHEGACPECARDMAYHTGLEAMRERAVAYLDELAAYYSAEIFPEPEPGQHGRTVDACSARALRAILSRVASAIRALEVHHG